MKTNQLLPALVAGTLLTACGGGTTTSSTTTGGTNVIISSVDNTVVDASSIYTGNSTLALLNTSNSMTFVDLALGTENINNNLSASRSTDTVSQSETSLLRTQQILSALASQQIARQRYQARLIDVSDTCPNGGTASVSGEVSNITFTGTLQMTYNQCKSENITTNGTALLAINAFNAQYQEASSYTISMKGLSILVDDVPYTSTGTLRTDVDMATQQSTLLINQYQRNLSTGKQQFIDNVSMLVDKSGYTTISGKFCEDVQGCITTTTVTPLLFAEDGVPLEGEIVLNGAANSKVQVIAQGYDTSTPPQRNLQVNLDADGNGLYESLSLRNASVLKNFSITSNAAPQVVVSLPSSVTLGEPLILDGSNTTDPENDFLTYQWIIESAPQGSVATLTAADSMTASFIPDQQGSYTFSLKVTDAFNNTSLATHKLTVIGTTPNLQ